jgi:phenylalanyl-tRNA synthetase alpha subunit
MNKLNRTRAMTLTLRAPISRLSAICRSTIFSGRAATTTRARALAPLPSLSFTSSRSLSTTAPSAAATPAATTTATINEQPLQTITNNIGASTLEKVGRNLHLQPHHPLNTIKTLIEEHFAAEHVDTNTSKPLFTTFDSLPPRVSTTACFDELLIPPTHPSRRMSDTFYFNAAECLRTHTSAHQNEKLRAGHRSFLVTGDCYRRDEIDASHYPVFHQVRTPCESVAKQNEIVCSRLSLLAQTSHPYQPIPLLHL